mmetsp:Transcript_8918/g.39259  ORF Transcript_8918/g.39259 Transcript_8918/m.39259 type:complete len:296 (-) Transcript_8918:233-1120(-)
MGPAVRGLRVDGRHVSHLHALRDSDASGLLRATVPEAARLRQAAPRDAAHHEQGDEDGDKDDRVFIFLALVVLDVVGHGHRFGVIARGAYRAVRHAVAILEALVFGDHVVVPVRARALGIRGAAVLVHLPPVFGVSKLPARGGDVGCVEDCVANPYILRERPADARVRVALVAQVVRAAAEGFLAAGHRAGVAILQACVVRAGGRVVHATGDAVLLAAAVGAAILLESALDARHVPGAAPPRAHPVVARAEVEALAVGLRAALFRALRLADAHHARDVVPVDVRAVEAVVLAARA